MSIVNFLYNPDRKSKDQLISEFVVRNKILEDIMGDLESSRMKTPEQHYLVVGQRGAGKSTFLNRIKYAVEDSVKLKPVLIPILFGEEQYNVGELANLWENVAQILEDYHGFNGLYGEMERNVHDKKFEEKCWDMLESALDRKEKKLLLLIDNIGDMFKKIDEMEVRRLRELLQTKPQIRLIGASPFYLESLLDYKQPMFEFFKVIRLDELTSEETFHLLLKLGEIHSEKEKIEKIINETPRRVESLRTLTGGVPRTIALMFNIFIEHEHESSLKDLDRILDNVTPLYKHRMDDLPAQQQKIVDALARNWDPISVKDLKDKVRLESKVISAQLRQLEKNQVVLKMETGTKNHEYILKERFFNIWYLMRYGRKDDRQRVLWLVRFLESWYTNEEIESRIMQFVQRSRINRTDKNKLRFFAIAYTSLNNLTTESKLMLEENFPEYSSTINFSDNEIDKIIQDKLEKKDWEGSLRWICFKSRISDFDKIAILKVVYEMTALDKENEVLDKIINIFDELRNGGKSLISTRQTYVIAYIIISEIYIIDAIGQEEIEEALRIKKWQLERVAKVYFEEYNFTSQFAFELKIILGGFRMLYEKGQYHSILKIFERGKAYNIEKRSNVRLSEMFNPIYLALISLDPEGKKTNIAPEKEEIVRQIRDFITGKT